MALAARPSKSAGKHPTLRPKASSSAPAALKVTKPKPVHAAKKQKPKSKPEEKSFKVTKHAALPREATTARRILTRSQSRIFRITDLPPELRNLIYQHIAALHSTEEPASLDTVTLPAEFSLSKQFRAEALSAFFAAGHFTMRVMSNYCVFRRHFHKFEHVRYDKAGSVSLSPLLGFDGSGASNVSDLQDGPVFQTALKESTVRFKYVTIAVECVCCESAKQIASLELGVIGKKAVVDCKLSLAPKEGDTATKPSLELIFARVKEAVEAIGGRQDFNGFKVADLEAIAGRMNYDGDEKVLTGRGFGGH